MQPEKSATKPTTTGFISIFYFKSAKEGILHDFYKEAGKRPEFFYRFPAR